MKLSLATLLACLMLTSACSTAAVGAATAGYGAYVNATQQKPARENPVDPIYCYNTIGGVDCYSASQDSQEYRLVGTDGTQQQYGPDIPRRDEDLTEIQYVKKQIDDTFLEIGELFKEQ